MAHNHYPIIGRSIPASCGGGAGDTANPFTPPTCPKCIERLQWKIDAELAGAANPQHDKQLRVLQAATAAHFQRILAGTEQVSA